MEKRCCSCRERRVHGSLISRTSWTIWRSVEDYLLKNHGGRVDGAYGSSLGGSFVGLLAQRGRVHIADDIHVDGTTIHVIYALKMGEKYGERYRRHFREPDIHEFDMKHEVWLYDEAWKQPVLDTIFACMERSA